VDAIVCVYVCIQLYCSCCHYGVIKHDDNPAQAVVEELCARQCYRHDATTLRYAVLKSLVHSLCTYSDPTPEQAPYYKIH